VLERGVTDDALGRVERALYLMAAMTGLRQGELRRRVVAATIDCVFVAQGRERVGKRVTVCPVGTAPRDLYRRGDHHVTLRSYANRPGWVSPGRSDLASAAWSRSRVEHELRAFARTHPSWPPANAFLNSGRDRLLAQVRRQGGEAVWAYRLGLPLESTAAARRAWTDDRIRAAPEIYLEGKSEWPTVEQFERDGLRPLCRAVSSHGGVRRWVKHFPIACDEARLRHRADRYWTDDLIATQLREFCRGRPSFPTQREFASAHKSGLLKAAQRYHGVRWWAERLNLRAAATTRRPSKAQLPQPQAPSPRPRLLAQTTSKPPARSSSP
jgi:hypothetical protein